MNVEQLVNHSSALVLVIGLLALFVQVVTELTKDYIIKKVPTKVYALIVSELSTVLGILSYMQYADLEIKPYHFVGCVALGFIVCYVATNGWEEFKALKDRMLRK